MSFKLALLLLFGLVALAVAVPLENTEEKAQLAEPVVADTEDPEALLEDSEADESEDDNLEDEDEETEADDDEEEPENEVEAKEEDENDPAPKPGPKPKCYYTLKRLPLRCFRKKKCSLSRVGRIYLHSCTFRKVCSLKRVKVCKPCRGKLVCKRPRVCIKKKCLRRGKLCKCIRKCGFKG